MNFPNILSILRIGLIPLFMIVFSTPTMLRSEWAAIIFSIASATDWFDGYIARKWGQVTVLGKLLDPVADKLLVLTALIMLVELDRLAAWIAIVIIGRDMAVTGLRAIASSSGIIIAAREMGKYKTTIQIVAILFLILNYRLEMGKIVINMNSIGTGLIWLAALLALISAIDYFLQFYRQLNK